MNAISNWLSSIGKERYYCEDLIKSIGDEFLLTVIAENYRKTARDKLEVDDESSKIPIFDGVLHYIISRESSYVKCYVAGVVETAHLDGISMATLVPENEVFAEYLFKPYEVRFSELDRPVLVGEARKFSRKQNKIGEQLEGKVTLQLRDTPEFKEIEEIKPIDSVY